jgi:hypothetical protein
MKSWADAFCCSPVLPESSLGSFCGADGNSEDSGMTGIVEMCLNFNKWGYYFKFVVTGSLGKWVRN